MLTGCKNTLIPSSVTSLGINCFSDCSGLTSITIPNSVTSLGDWCFEGCSGLTSITIPNSVTSLGYYCFSDCYGLTSITIPNSVTSLGNSCFKGCSGLTSVTIPNSVTSLSYECFEYCSGLTSITIPNSVTSLGSYCFSGCYGLTSITIPNSVTSLGSRCFNDCIALETIKVDENNPVFDSRDNCNAIIHTDTNIMIAGCKSTIIPNSVTSLGEGCFEGCSGLTSITIPNSVTSLGKVCFSDCSGLTSITIPNSVTSLGDWCFEGCYGLTSITIPNSVTSLSYECFENCSGLTSIIIPNSVTSIGDGCFRGCNNLSAIYCYPIPYLKHLDNNFDLWTDAEVKLYGGPICNLSLHKATPTTLIIETDLSTNYTPAPEGEEVEIAAISVTHNNTEYDCIDNNLYRISDLELNTPYEISATIKYSDGYEINTNETFSTILPELTILQPKCVSNSCAIVAAMTNCDDVDTNAGFQWKKYDAPESLAPNEAYAAIYDGKLEGYLKNLQSAFYYNVRAFYKSDNGTYYYSDWVTFDPSDFSYFEPTVHTYPVTKTTDCTASVRGYALAGTDEIKEQGFEYWEADGGAAAPKLVKTAALVPAEEDIHTVLASGQVMQVVLDGLKPMTTYICRAFVRTESGTTYGEEQAFATEAPTAIGNVEAETAAPTVVGYYDLSGRRLAGKQRGIVIERYSDGTARKVFVK